MSEETILFSDGIPHPNMTYDVTGRVKNEYNNLRISSKDDLDTGISRYMDEVGNLIIDILLLPQLSHMKNTLKILKFEYILKIQ